MARQIHLFCKEQDVDEITEGLKKMGYKQHKIYSSVFEGYDHSVLIDEREKREEYFIHTIIGVPSPENEEDRKLMKLIFQNSKVEKATESPGSLSISENPFDLTPFYDALGIKR